MSGATPRSTGPGAVAPTGSIYDLGYRRYTGPRLGRRHAVLALFRDSFRAAFGLGRSGRAKAAPFAIAVLALLPAVVAVGVAGLASQVGAGSQVSRVAPVRYDNYYSLIAQLLFLFAAAQAPELVGRDLRHHVLPLFFSRALRRTDYALAKAGALFTVLALIELVPQVLLFLGRALASTDVVDAVRADLGSVPAVVGQAAIAAAVLASVSLAIGSYSGRRSYATAGIIVAFILPPIVAGILRGLAVAPGVARWVAVVSAPDVLDGTNRWLFDLPPSSRLAIDGPLAGAVAVAMIAVALGVLLRRYRTIPA